MEKDKISGACGTYLCGKNLKKRNHLEDKDIDGRIILKCLTQVGWKWTGLI
jgi:hypothetical protein